MNMTLFEENMSRGESMRYMAAGFVPLTLGLVLFIFDVRASVVGAVGALTFLFGYFGWSPLKAILPRK